MRATLPLIVAALCAFPLVGCGKQIPSPAAPRGSGGPAPAHAGDGEKDDGTPQNPPPVAVKGRPWNGLIMGPRTGNDSTIVIKEVSANSPAEKAGLKVGDVILKKNGEPLTDPDSFRTWIKSLPPETQYTLTIQREGKELEVSVTVGYMPQSAEGGSKRAAPEALQAGMLWLSQQQLENGAWPHASKAVIGEQGKPNPAVTGLALSALSLTKEGRAKYAAQIAKGIEYMLSCETPNGYLAEAGDAMKYGNFATAYAVIVMSRLDKAKYGDSIKKFVAYFEKWQIGERHGFEPYDWPYGAWDYYDDIRPRPMRADIVLASLVIEALHAAEVPKDAPVMQHALKYIKLCQNWKDDANQLSDRDDGGFFFTPREGKAGEEEIGGGGNLRFKSYGSVTCDGIRSLLDLGEAKDSARVKAGLDWMATNYGLDAVPGFRPGLAVDFAHGLRYYYYMSMAKTMQTCGDPVLRTPQGKENKWTSDLAGYVAGLQRPEGSWANGVTVMNEDDPIFATGMAIHALAIALGQAK